MRARHILLTLCLLGVSAAAGCKDPPTDIPRSRGGTAPDPTGVMHGVILYSGPQPTCRTEGSTRAPVGIVVITLFEFENPPPPAGTAETAVQLLTIPGTLLFPDPNDCRPADWEPGDPLGSVTRTVEFAWPEIPLDVTPLDPADPTAVRDVGYLAQGFYDDDASFHPFFAVTQSPSQGDVVGAALVDPQAAVPEIARVAFGNIDDYPLGQVVRGVTISLGAVVDTAQPAFELRSGPLSSQATLPDDQNDPEGDLAALTNNAVLHLFEDDEVAPVAAALAAGGRSILFEDRQAYAWYRAQIDANNDGTPELHPVFGSQGVPWYSPAVFLVRQQHPNEVAAGIPRVALVPSVPFNPTNPKSTYFPDIPLYVAPAAGVVLNPAEPLCQIGYLAPNNLALYYEASSGDPVLPDAVECQELPTGSYGINVLHGFAAATFTMGPPIATDTGLLMVTGRFASEVWRIPNELGDPAQLGGVPAVPSQGEAGTFFVHDPTSAMDPNVNVISRGDGRTECINAPTSPARDMTRLVIYPDFEDQRQYIDICCEPVRHLCDLPLCPFFEDGDPEYTRYGGRNVRRPPTTLRTNRDWPDRQIPDCVPFRMPAFCCLNPQPT